MVELMVPEARGLGTAAPPAPDGADPRVGLAGLSRRELVGAVRARQLALVEAEAAVAAVLASVGDVYGVDADDDRCLDDPRAERSRSGPDGMPGFSEYAGAEIGPILKCVAASADYEVRSMLVMRHRHPLLWEAVMAGRVRVRQAKKLIGLGGMAGLSLEQAWWLDRQLSTAVGLVTFGRLVRLAEGLIVAADTDAAEERRLTAARARYVRLAQLGDGVAFLEVRGSAHDLVVFNAMVDHVADLLAREGDVSSQQVRRAKAVGELANPARAVLLLQRHHGQDDQGNDGDADTGPVAAAPVGADWLGSDHDRESDVDPVDGDPRSAECDGAGATARAAQADDDADGPDASDEPEPEPEKPEPYPPDPLDPPDPHPEWSPASPFTDTAKVIITVPPDRLAPRAVLYVHVSADTLLDQALCEENGVARVEQVGAVTARLARDWLGGARVRVQPVIDLDSGPVVDAYEVRGRLREQVIVRDGFDVFPFGERAARGCDLDHATPFRIAGQTDPADVNPLSRRAHRAKTHAGWRRVNTAPGRTEWTSPAGQRYAVDHGRTTGISIAAPTHSAGTWRGGQASGR